MTMTRHIILTLLLALFHGCASPEPEDPRPPLVDARTAAEQSADDSAAPGTVEAGQEEPRAPKEKKLPPPRSLSELMARVAQRAAEQIPLQQPWMVVITVEGNDLQSERYEKVVANELVRQLQSQSGEDKCFMVTTPEIRKQIIEEQTESLSDFYNEDTGLEVGNLVRAHAVLKAPIQDYSDHLLVSLQLLSMDNGAILYISDERIPMNFLPKPEPLDPEIVYSSYRSGSHAIRTFPIPANAAGLEVDVDGNPVFEGQTYNIDCRTKAPGYLYLFDLQTDGTLAVLLPNCIPLEELNGGFLDNRLEANSAFTTRGRFELTASIAGKETILAVLTEHKLDVSGWEKVYTELGREYPQYHWYTFGRNGTIRDCLEMLRKQLNEPETGYWYADWKEFSIVK